LALIGLDIDGVLRKLPLPIRYAMKYSSPTDIFEKARLGFIKRRVLQGLILYTPFILNGPLIERFKTQEVVIISSRKEDCEELSSLFQRYLKVKSFYCRGNQSIYEKDFKLKYCRQANIQVFYEDRKYIVKFLRENGINVVEV